MCGCGGGNQSYGGGLGALLLGNSLARRRVAMGQRNVGLMNNRNAALNVASRRILFGLTFR